MAKISSKTVSKSRPIYAENRPPWAISRSKVERTHAEIRYNESMLRIKNRNPRYRTEATPKVEVPEE